MDAAKGALAPFVATMEELLAERYPGVQFVPEQLGDLREDDASFPATRGDVKRLEHKVIGKMSVLQRLLTAVALGSTTCIHTSHLQPVDCGTYGRGYTFKVEKGWVKQWAPIIKIGLFASRVEAPLSAPLGGAQCGQCRGSR